MGYSIILTTTPLLSFWGIIIEDSYAVVNEIFQRFGVVEFKIVPMKEPPLNSGRNRVLDGAYRLAALAVETRRKS